MFLREMGVSDIWVFKKVRVMGEVFYGWVDVYILVIDVSDIGELVEWFGWNIYLE